ncbi:hypothetical protein ACSBIA_004860 [Enterobacter hormaechei]|uniref:hypothetical protein n=1 Tax=Enterobacter kobei TaxID=208224 RepID=UPI002F2FED37|nr:hypothetical protein [Enterobacter kobei]
MGYSFEIRSSVDLFNELSCRVDDYNNDNLSSGKAVVCSIFCWHLVEWIYHEYGDQLTEFKNLKDFNEYVKTSCGSLSFIQDVANGSKHRGINRYKPTVRSTERKNGAFSSGFSNGFDISCLRMEIEGGKFVYFYEEIDKALSFLRFYLNGLTDSSLINKD